MALADTTVRLVRPTGKSFTVTDADGLALFVSAKGAKNWHFRFYWNGRQVRISLGCYPEVSLKDARERRDEARALVAKGIDPRAHRREERRAAALAADNTFEAVFQRWRDFKAHSLKTGRQSTLSQLDRIFKKDVLPTLAQRSIFEIARADLLDVLRRIERRKALTTAEKCRTWFNQMFRYALVEVNLETNPAADLDIVAMPQPPVRHNPFLRMDELPAFLKQLRSYRGDINTRLGLRLLLLTGVRTGELRSALPEQFHLEHGLWIIPPVIVKQLQVKLRRESQEIPPYIVPLPKQAVEIIRFLLATKGTAQRYLLPHRSDPKERMSENTLNGALTRMGYKDRLTGHGIRATISTALNELGLRALHAEGLRIVMLKGDNRTTADAVAGKLRIDEVIADVQPADKAGVIERLQREGKTVAMAGDGINDAPALAQADVGIAMGTGTDIAMESAQVTLVRGDLQGIVRARHLSRSTVRNIWQNLVFAFGYNTLGIPIAAGVLYPFFGLLLSPVIAAVAMSLSSVSVIGNALRLRGSVRVPA